MGNPRIPGRTRSWSQEEDEQLVALFNSESTTIEEIGVKMKRSASSVRGRLTRLRREGRVERRHGGGPPDSNPGRVSRVAAVCETYGHKFVLRNALRHWLQTGRVSLANAAVFVAELIDGERERARKEAS